MKFQREKFKMSVSSYNFHTQSLRNKMQSQFHEVTQYARHSLARILATG
jgi:hypothetical protein